MAQVLCPHGNLVDGIDVTMIGDPRPVYIFAMCDCPRVYCPFCHTELAADGRCQGDIECVLFGHPVPVPDVR